MSRALALAPTKVNVSAEDCPFLVVQGPGRVEFTRLPKLDDRPAAGDSSP